ncbi:MAG TPA: hypothetical protein VGK67_23915 [Myxococcales bacterium]|jgi:hypothetical protein
MKRLVPLALVMLLAAAGVAVLRGGQAPAAGPDAALAVDTVDRVDVVDRVDAAERVPEAAPADASRPPSDEELTVRLRAVVDASPEEALALAAEAERAFPSSRFADERSFLVMRALVHLNRIGEARNAAAEFHRRFPESAWAEQVGRLTGYQPRRYGPRR